MNTPTLRKRSTSAEDKIKIIRILEQQVIVRQDGMVEYKPGYSDQVIADQLGVSPNSVAHLRTSGYGHLYKEPSSHRQQTISVQKLDQILSELGVIKFMLMDMTTAPTAKPKDSPTPSSDTVRLK